MTPADTTPLARLLARLQANSDAFEAQLAALPSSRPCEHHVGHTAVLLVDRSWKEGRPVYGCPACADDIRSRRRARRMAAAGIPADVRHATLANFQLQRPHIHAQYQTPPQFLEAAHKFLARAARNAILAGQPGIGKGHIAAAIAIHFLDAGRSVTWTDCASLFSEYHQAYATNSTEAVTARHAEAYLLVLDEICLRDLPADGEEILFSIIDRRHKAAMQTLMLTNKTASVVRTWLGGRIYDRLKSGGCLFRYGEWESMRGSEGDGSEF